MSFNVPEQYLNNQNLLQQYGNDLRTNNLTDNTSDFISSDWLLNLLQNLTRMKDPDNPISNIQESPTYLRAQKTFLRYQTAKSQVEDDQAEPKDERSVEQLEMYKKELIESIRQLEKHYARLQRLKTIKKSNSSENLTGQISIENAEITKRYIRRTTSEQFDKGPYGVITHPASTSESSLFQEVRPKLRQYDSPSWNIEKGYDIKRPFVLAADYHPTAYTETKQREYHSQEAPAQKYEVPFRPASLASIPNPTSTNKQEFKSNKKSLHRESVVDHSQDVMGKPRQYDSLKSKVIIPRKDDRRSGVERERIILPPQAFGNQPAVTTCPVCNETGITVLKQVPSDTAWIVCVGCALMGCACGCCLIPFCIPSLSTWYHYCPNCKRQLGCKEAQGLNM